MRGQLKILWLFEENCSSPRCDPLFLCSPGFSLLPFTSCIFSSVSPSKPALPAPCHEIALFPFCKLPGPHTTSHFPHPQALTLNTRLSLLHAVTRVLKINLDPSFLFSEPFQDSPLLLVPSVGPSHPSRLFSHHIRASRCVCSCCSLSGNSPHPASKFSH